MKKLKGIYGIILLLLFIGCAGWAIWSGIVMEYEHWGSYISTKDRLEAMWLPVLSITIVGILLKLES